MEVAFLILYLLSNELTYMVAVHQQMGLVYHISAGGLCWINRIVMIIPCIWYCGWIIGILLFLFSLFGLLHATIGWVLTIPSLFAKSDKTIQLIVELECNLLIPVNIICLIFTVMSFFLSKFQSVFFLFDSRISIIILLSIMVVGFFVRLLVSRLMKDV